MEGDSLKCPGPECGQSYSFMGSLISHLDTFHPEESAGADETISILVQVHPQDSQLASPSDQILPSPSDFDQRENAVAVSTSCPKDTITNLPLLEESLGPENIDAVTTKLMSPANDAVINLDILTVSEIDPSTSSGEDDERNANGNEDNASVSGLSYRSFAAASGYSGGCLEVVDEQKSCAVSEISSIADGLSYDDEIVADSVADLTSASDLDSLSDHHHHFMAYSVELDPPLFRQTNDLDLDDDNIVVEDSVSYISKFSSTGDSSDSDMSVFFQNARLADEETELALLTKDLQQQAFEKTRTPSPVKRRLSSRVPESYSEVAADLQNNPFSPSAILKRTKKLNKMARKLKKDIRKRRILSDSSDIIRDEDTIWNSVASQRTLEIFAPDGLESER